MQYARRKSQEYYDSDGPSVMEGELIVVENMVACGDHTTALPCLDRLIASPSCSDADTTATINYLRAKAHFGLKKCVRTRYLDTLWSCLVGIGDVEEGSGGDVVVFMVICRG